VCWVVFDGTCPGNLGTIWRLLLDQVSSKTYKTGKESHQRARDWYSCCIYGIYGPYMTCSYGNGVSQVSFKILVSHF